MKNTDEHKKIEYKTQEEILIRGNEAIGKTVRQIDKYGRVDSDGIKGGIGHVIEESLYGYKINSDAEPDFPEAGVELKVTGVIKDKNGYKAKERLVLNIINYMKEAYATFDTSSFWHKNKTLMLLFYEYKRDHHPGDFMFLKAILFKYPAEDLVIIKDDWQKIIEKIRAGRAHELSEGDTFYLGACTKGATAATSLRPQPFSDIPAKQRAYCLKNKYMTYLVRRFVFGEAQDEHIIKSASELDGRSFESYVTSKLEAYKGKSVEELKQIFDVKSDAKNLGALLAYKILGIKGNKAAELENAGVAVKTIRIQHNGRIKESMSFAPFKFREVASETWEDAEFANTLRDTKFLFIVYRFDKEGVLRLMGGQFWNMPYNDIEEHVKNVWGRTKDILNAGCLTVTIRNNRMMNNLPAQADNPVSHVRPHGATRLGTTNLLPEGTKVNIASTDESFVWPYEDRFPTQCFWLNNTYILSQLNDEFKKSI